jgi:hypothetical protein
MEGPEGVSPADFWQLWNIFASGAVAVYTPDVKML